MKTTMFVVQPFEGGAELQFPAVPPTLYRAKIALASDPEFSILPEAHRDFLVGAANAMLSAAKRGIAAELHIPNLVNVKTVEGWASDYCISIVDDEIPDAPSGDADKAAFKNPTEPKE